MLRHLCPARHMDVHVAYVTGPSLCLQSLKSVVLREETKPASWDPFSLPERRQEAGASRRTGRPGRTGTAERGQLYAPRLRLVLEDVLLPTLSWEPW